MEKYFSTGNNFPSRKSDVLSNRLSSNGIRPNTAIEETYFERKERSTASTRTLSKQCERLSQEDGLLYRRITDLQEHEVRQVVLPEIVKEKVKQSLHNDMGHQGLEATISLARTRCYWPRMYADIEKWIKSYERRVLSKMPQPPIRTPIGHLTAWRLLSIFLLSILHC